MKVNHTYLNGAKQIIKRCLGLQPGQNLLIFADETTHELATIINDAAYHLGVFSTIIFIPTHRQRDIPSHIDLSDLIQNAARDARGILTCVTSDPECLPFRDRILASQWNARTRIGHMPGANPATLELANVDFDKLIDDCHNLELAMARGKMIRIVTKTKEGREHVLTSDLGGWKRIPVASDGVIADGVWGNVPSGETYIAPIEGTAKGSIVINGSIPGMFVGNQSEFIINFEGGNVASFTPLNNSALNHLTKTQIDVAMQQADTCWNNLAEIGIGVNPGLSQLTGKMLLDEKCAGTAHIALGDNKFMGGNIKASIHCDMVFINPSIFIDEKNIISNGQLIIDPLDWHDDYSSIDLHNSPLKNARQVCYSGTQVVVHNGSLQRALHSEPGRISYYPVGDYETSLLAQKIHNRLPKDGDWLDITKLAGFVDVEEITLKKILHVMHEFELIRFN